MQYWGHIYTTKLFFVFLKFRCNRVSAFYVATLLSSYQSFPDSSYLPFWVMGNLPSSPGLMLELFSVWSRPWLYVFLADLVLSILLYNGNMFFSLACAIADSLLVDAIVGGLNGKPPESTSPTQALKLIAFLNITSCIKGLLHLFLIRKAGDGARTQVVSFSLFSPWKLQLSISPLENFLMKQVLLSGPLKTVKVLLCV